MEKRKQCKAYKNRKRCQASIGRLREYVRNNLAVIGARSGNGLLKKLRMRNPDRSFNKEEKRWYSWMMDKRRTMKEKAEMKELNALVNYSSQGKGGSCRGCEIDGVYVECSFSTRVPGGKASVLPNTNCLLCSETRLKTYVYDETVPQCMTKAARCGSIFRSLKTYYAWREEHPAVYDAAMDRIIRWVPELKDYFERAVANDKIKTGLCRGCEIDGVHVECIFSPSVPGGKVIPRPHTSCLLCSETRLKTFESVKKRWLYGVLLSLLKRYYAWREEHPAVYDAVMDRISRWVPELKDHFERAAAKAKVKHMPPVVKHKPAVSLEERGARPVQRKHATTQFSCRRTSTKRKHGRT